MSEDTLEILEKQDEEVTKIRLIESDTVLEVGDTLVPNHRKQSKEREILQFDVTRDLWETNTLYYTFAKDGIYDYDGCDTLNTLDIELRENEWNVE